jgi:hypothetical protein
MTKLFQSRDVILRRMVYLGIKELSAIAEDLIIVTSSLTKDMTGKEDLYRAAAIRALCSITDVSIVCVVFCLYSRIYTLEFLLLLPSSSSVVFTILSEPHSRPTTSQNIWKRQELYPNLWICSQELWPLDHRGGPFNSIVIPKSQKEINLMDTVFSGLQSLQSHNIYWLLLWFWVRFGNDWFRCLRDVVCCWRCF